MGNLLNFLVMIHILSFWITHRSNVGSLIFLSFLFLISLCVCSAFKKNCSVLSSHYEYFIEFLISKLTKPFVFVLLFLFYSVPFLNHG